MIREDLKKEAEKEGRRRGGEKGCLPLPP